MIPQFPTFKKLELSDKPDIDTVLNGYPTYSDFEFGSLWSWDIQEDVELSLLNGNLAVRFADYLSGKPFFMFFGEEAVNETAAALIAESQRRGYENRLRLIPEISAKKLDQDRFEIKESRDHFDYLYEIGQYITYSGTKLKSRRNFLNGFLKKHPNYHVKLLSLDDPATGKEILALFERWEENKHRRDEHERTALIRFLRAEAEFEYLALGVYVDNALAAFCTCVLLPGAHANALFGKADITYHGIYAFLMHEIAKELMKRGYTHLNYQQDLGIENLRKSKMAFHPTDFLKKYDVTPKT